MLDTIMTTYYFGLMGIGWCLLGYLVLKVLAMIPYIILDLLIGLPVKHLEVILHLLMVPTGGFLYWWIMMD